MTDARLVLGTVQLGMRYGLSNATGQPPEDESFRILDRAYEQDIDTFDTAHSYGNAEDVLGRWIAERSRTHDVRIISKLKPNVLDERGGDAADIIVAEAKRSLERLGLERLDGFLFHTPQYVHRADALDGLRRVQAEGLAEHIGASVYDPTEALHALEVGLDYIQVPYNALDRRLERTDFFQRAESQGAVVFARSPFLQGLLLMDPERVPEHLAQARPLLSTFRAIAKRHGFSPLEAALAVSLGRGGIQAVVFGVETTQQLDEILRAARRAEDTETLRAEIVEAIPDADASIVNPSLWVQN